MIGNLHHVQRQGWTVEAHERPSTVEEAVAALVRYGERARPVAGGSDLLLELDRGARPDVDVLVDLTGIPGLSTIEPVPPPDADNGRPSFRLGALVTHNQVVADPDARLLKPLAQACWEVGSPQLRNRATVVGNVVTASPANDTISALLALGTTVEVAAADGVRSVPLDAFITGFRTTRLAPGELVTGLRVDGLGPDQHGLFVKLGLRRAQAISVVHLATVLTFNGPSVTDARLAVGSVGPTVTLLPEVSERLIGQRLDGATIEAAAEAAAAAVRPIDDLRAPADYRRRSTATMVTRALHSLAAERAAEVDRADARRVGWTTPPLLRPTHVDGRLGPAERVADDAPPRRSLGQNDEIVVHLNGRPTRGPALAGTLLDWAREHGGATGVKEGCAEGECGACTVHIDGLAVMGCLVPAASVDGAEVTTVEGLADQPTDTAAERSLHVVQEAFMATGAVQCGFCTPGFVMAVAALLAEDPSPDRSTVTAALAGNLCRCTGYEAIHAAVSRAAAASSSSVTGEVRSDRNDPDEHGGEH